MKTSLIILSIVGICLFSCKKDDPTPTTVTKTDTITVTKTNTVHDTTTVMPFQEIIQGSWNIYELNNNSVNYTFTCTQTTVTISSSGTNNVTYSADYSTIYNSSNGNPLYLVYHNGPNELKIYNVPFSYYFFIRR